MNTGLRKKTVIALILLFCFANIYAQAPSVNASENIEKQDSQPSRNAWLNALWQGVMINAIVHGFGRCVARYDFSQVSYRDIGNNFRRGFVWDNDEFLMNQLAHPYHGGLYFAAARAQGLNFWQSIPFTVFGSWQWEFLCENNYPALNDFITTSFAGLAFGEVMHRLSALVVDESKRGGARLRREILAGIISPMDGFNRLITGRAWRHCNDGRTARRHEETFRIDFSVYNRFVTDLDNNSDDDNNIVLGITAVYGCPFEYRERFRPYDFFTFDLNFNVIGNEPFVPEATVTGALWGRRRGNDTNAFFSGIFQHFSYYDQNSFRFTAPASVGWGILYRRQNENSPNFFTGGFHANAVFFSASGTEYYNVYQRNYNFGSGYSLKLSALMNFSNKFIFTNLRHYNAFTLIRAENRAFYGQNQNDYNVKGIESNAMLNILSAGLGYRLTDNLTLSLEQRFFLHRSRYRAAELASVSSNAMETRLRLTYSIF
ncbi:MAG: DUF3943 domain-containing protein [Elusimicrobia bacterium]|nr:DUF3943 domain-containing protein [Elusimicrobiota bacterium]